MRRGRRLLLAAATTVWMAAPAAGSGLRAEQIRSENVAELQIGGPDAIGGLGDWYLANDRIELIVDDPSRRHGKLNHGGTIVDAGLRGRKGDDQFARLFPVLNLNQRVQLGMDAIRAEVDPEGGFARLVATGHLQTIPRGGAWARRFDVVPEPSEVAGVTAETEYRVLPGEPFVRITTTLHNEGQEDAPIFSYGDVWMRGGRGMRSFVGNVQEPERSRGYHHLSFDRDHLLVASDAMAGFDFVAMSGMPQLPPIVYALFSPERRARGLVSFGVTGKHVTLMSGIVGDPDWKEMGLWRLLRSTRARLAPGEAWRFERRLMVVAGGDVAAATDLIFPLLEHADGGSGIRGRVEPRDLRVAVHVDEAASGAPVTQAASDGKDGRYGAVLPPGDYRLTLRSPFEAPRQLEVSVPPGGFVELPVQRFAEPGFLVFDPAFSDRGPGRIVVEGVGESADPVFGAELLDFRIDGKLASSGTETRELHFLGNAHDARRVAIAPGRYRLTAARGLQYDVAEQEIEVAGSGDEVRVPPFSLTRVVALRGILSADLHVHAQASDDSSMSNEARLGSFVAEAVDVIVSSDHDHLSNFDPALDALGLRGRIAVVRGVEVTSSAPSPAAPWTIGHNNAWPLPYRPELHRSGAPPSQDLRLAELYAVLRADYGARVVQLNHPFGHQHDLEEGDYLTHLGSAGKAFDPERPLEAEPNRLLLETASDGRTRAVDFDAIEVMNGSSWPRYLQTRAAWYALLRQGYRRTATGNSDTHGPDEPAGYPRNYVFTDSERFVPEAFDAAVREGRLFFTNGPLIGAFRANGARMGELAAVPDGRVELELAVVAAPWVPVEEVRLLVNGSVVRRFRALAGAEEPVRWEWSGELHPARDAFVTLEAGAPLDVEPEVWAAQHAGPYTRLAPGFVAQGVSNAIYLDVDGNGRFDPPGLAVPLLRPDTRRRLGVTVGVVLLLALLWWRLRSRAGLGPPSYRSSR